MNDNLFNTENTLQEGDDLFGFEEIEETEDPQDENPKAPDNKEETQPSTEVDISEDDLFDDDEEEEETEEPESVGEGKDKTGKEANPNNGSGSSPKGFNPYSSFAQALKGDGLFQNLDDEKVAKISDADSFYEAFEDEINSRLDAETRRVKEALDAGVEVSAIQESERTIKKLESITEEDLSDESEKGKKLRASIIYQDYINKGFTEQRAKKEVKRIFEANTDIEDAADAFESVKEFFKDRYNSLIEEEKVARKAEEDKIREEQKQLKKALLETEKVFDSIPVDKQTRQKAYDYMTKVVKTSEDGERLTAVQLFADENPVEFRTILGFVAALTEGFKKPSSLFNKVVDKKVRSNLKEIEARVRGSQHRGGAISFAEGDDELEQEPRRRFRLA